MTRAVVDVPVGGVIREICTDLKYSRSHVSNVMRRNAEKLKAERRGARWWMPFASIAALRRLVEKSGPRYKLGETGARG